MPCTNDQIMPTTSIVVRSCSKPVTSIRRRVVMHEQIIVPSPHGNKMFKIPPTMSPCLSLSFLGGRTCIQPDNQYRQSFQLGMSRFAKMNIWDQHQQQRTSLSSVWKSVNEAKRPLNLCAYLLFGASHHKRATTHRSAKCRLPEQQTGVRAALRGTLSSLV